jgi:hypothetical protein
VSRIARIIVPTMDDRTCLKCNKDISHKRADARFCGALCKKQWQRAEAKKPSAAELEELKRLESPQFRKGNRL